MPRWPRLYSDGITSPFAPKSYKVRGPLRPPDYPPLMRFRRLGLREDEFDAVTAGYRAMSDAEKFDALERYEYMTDDEIRQHIIEGRAERGVV